MMCTNIHTAAVAQWIKAFAWHTEGRVFESKPRQTLVVKTGSDSSIARVLGDDHYKLMPRVIVSVARLRTISA